MFKEMMNNLQRAMWRYECAAALRQLGVPRECAADQACQLQEKHGDALPWDVAVDAAIRWSADTEIAPC